MYLDSRSFDITMLSRNRPFLKPRSRASPLKHLIQSLWTYKLHFHFREWLEQLFLLSQRTCLTIDAVVNQSSQSSQPFDELEGEFLVNLSLGELSVAVPEQYFGWHRRNPY